MKKIPQASLFKPENLKIKQGPRKTAGNNSGSTRSPAFMTTVQLHFRNSVVKKVFNSSAGLSSHLH